jgi:hypothetical protein
MKKQAKSLMIAVAVLACSVGCVQFSHRPGKPNVTNFADAKMDLAETQFQYKVAALNLDRFVQKELLSQGTLPDYYLQAFEKLQKAEIKNLTDLQEFNRLQDILNSYHAQSLILGMKTHQKTPLKIHRFLMELKRHEDGVAELQSRYFSLLQQKQEHQVAFLFATDSP